MGERLRRRDRTSSAVLVLVVLSVLLLTSCGVPPPESQTCISWAGFADDVERAESAVLVIEGRVDDVAGERSMFGTEATVWRVRVSATLKGDVEPGEHLDVASTPRTCEVGSPYPEGDPMDTEEPLRLYLTDSDFAVEGTEHGWALTTPFDGVQPAESRARDGR